MFSTDLFIQAEELVPELFEQKAHVVDQPVELQQTQQFEQVHVFVVPEAVRVLHIVDSDQGCQQPGKDSKKLDHEAAGEVADGGEPDVSDDADVGLVALETADQDVAEHDQVQRQLEPAEVGDQPQVRSHHQRDQNERDDVAQVDG
eukprot:CAMPEP_0168319216 /NCGR_PEP_ID=MMETSP0213-20121227/924_1 /TAXON_ID=151035 /ORGANISM="Euplotes harpa, Strain FSP1.4" /LENGTH=145 /DNA_ID=CAMNT_0008320395 /DNA_START=678 /DNA_END=1115 /DNA_ORIENTATION=+